MAVCFDTSHGISGVICPIRGLYLRGTNSFRIIGPFHVVFHLIRQNSFGCFCCQVENMMLLGQVAYDPRNRRDCHLFYLPMLLYLYPILLRVGFCITRLRNVPIESNVEKSESRFN